jgi:DNA anti-recombination protein RmuC
MRITSLSIRCATEQMFETGMARTALLAWLADRGLALKSETDEDPDWPEMTFEVSALAQEARTLRAALSAAKADLASHKTELQKAHQTKGETLTTAEAAQQKATQELTQARTRIETTEKFDALELYSKVSSDHGYRIGVDLDQTGGQRCIVCEF